MSDLAGITLSHYKIVLLPETHAADGSNLLTDENKSVLRTYVTEHAGNLIAFKPDTSLADLFGLQYKTTYEDGSYIRILTSTPIGRCIVPDNLKTHGFCDVYDLIADGVPIAENPVSEETAAGFRAYAGGGHALAFGFNMPGSIVWTRQGNPAKANGDWNHDGCISAQDLFVDDWNDIRNNAINQADEQMRVFSRAVEYFLDAVQPLPRSWYFPNQLKSLIILTDDCEDSKVRDILSHAQDVTNAYPSATMTFYIKDLDRLTTNEIKDLNTFIAGQGGEISAHADDTIHLLDPSYNNMRQVMRSYQELMRIKFGLNISTIRNHWVLWCQTDEHHANNYLEQAALEDSFGINMDCNYYHFDKMGTLGYYLGGAGGFTGSGLIMRFAYKDGSLSGVYQSVTQLPDQQYEIRPHNHAPVFYPEALKLGFQSLLDKSLGMESYAFINMNFHTIRWVANGNAAYAREPGLFILNYAKSLQVPVCSAQKAWNFVDAKNNVQFTNISFADDVLKFTIKPARACDGYTFLLPIEVDNRKDILSGVQIDGREIDYTTDYFKGKQYAFVTLNLDGSNREVAAKYSRTSIFSSSSIPLLSNQNYALDLGTCFYAAKPGRVDAIRVYAPGADRGTHHLRLWRNDNNKCLYSENAAYTGSNNWIVVPLSYPVYLDTNVEYTVTVSTPYDGANHFPYSSNMPPAANSGSCLTLPPNPGVYIFSEDQRPTNRTEFHFFRDVIFHPVSAQRYENIFYNKTPSTEYSASALELGVKFSCTIPGNIYGVRFYAVCNETGDHIISLWKNGSQPIQIASPVVANVAGSNAWYNYTFGLPVRIEANTEYIVSISTGTSNQMGYCYAAIKQDVGTAGNNNSYLTYPANAGVFGQEMGHMPTNSLPGLNYCRDIIFEPDESLFNNNAAHYAVSSNIYHLGTIFSCRVPGNIRGVRCFATHGKNSGNHTIRIWHKNSRTILTNSEVSASLAFGHTQWGTYMYNTPIHVEANVEYIVSVSTTTNGRYDYEDQGCSMARNNGSNLNCPANAGVYTTDPNAMPDQTWRQMNYLRDIIFEPDQE